MITNNDAASLKANSLRVKGANITVTGIQLSSGDPLPDNPANGIFIRRQGNKVSKIYIR